MFSTRLLVVCVQLDDIRGRSDEVQSKRAAEIRREMELMFEEKLGEVQQVLVTGPGYGGGIYTILKL